MSGTVYNLSGLLKTWREGDFNPVVTKELRQAVRNSTVTGMLITLLSALFLATLFFVIERQLGPEPDQRLGGHLIQVFIPILAGANLVFIPLYIGVRLAIERIGPNMDLMFFTALSPGRIVRGKFLCGAYLAILFFSACMPFMVFTNLLRGVDVPTIIFILVSIYVLVCLAIQAAILVACLPLAQIAKLVAGILFAVGLIAGCGLLVSLLISVVHSGAITILNSQTAWVGYIVILIGTGLLIQLLHAMSVTMLAANNQPPGFTRENDEGRTVYVKRQAGSSSI